MNNEIKELIDYFQKDIDKFEESKKYLMKKYGYDAEVIDCQSYHQRHINTKKLLDYITNLQEENKELNDDNIWWNNRFKAVQRDYEDYKSRNEKAIEYIECGKTFDDIETARIIDKYEKILLEILKGSDKE